MNITITGRNIKVSQNQKEHAEKKLGKLANYFNQLMDVHVILYVEKLDHAAEVIVNGDGVQFHGREKSGDLFSAIDLLLDKMEKQIVRYKERHQLHKGPAKDEPLQINMAIGSDTELMLNQASMKPIERIEAYLQMKMNKTGFILFKLGLGEVQTGTDFANKNYAVMFEAGDETRLVEIPFEAIKEHHFECDKFIEYRLKVIDASPASPKIDFDQVNECSIQKQTIDQAYDEAKRNNLAVYPFFNVESQYFNVMYRNGREYEVMVPAY